MSPERLSGTNAYVYSIVDNDVLDISNYNVNVYNISEFYDNKHYITYDTALELLDDKKMGKVLK